MSLFVLAEPLVVEAFALVGIPGRTPASGQDLGEMIARLTVQEGARLVLVQSHLAGRLSDAVLDQLARKHGCVVAELPGLDGSLSDVTTFRRFAQSSIGVLS